MTDRRVLDAKRPTTSSGIRARLVARGLLALLVVLTLMPAASAHFTENARHLGIHAWKEFIGGRVYTRKQINSRTYTKAQANGRYYTKTQIDGGATGCQGVAPDDVMVKVGGLCVDAYEASIWDAPVGGNQITAAIPCSVNGQNCTNIYARSVAGVEPRGDITWFQAQQALANSGKRLLSNAEWQMVVAGTPGSIPECNVSSGSVALTGANPDCISHHGTFEMVGNLWEWVGDWVPASTACPGWGDSDDTMCLSGASTTNAFPGALIRGGDFSDDAAAGPLAVSGIWRPSFSFARIGFRGAR